MHELEEVDWLVVDSPGVGLGLAPLASLLHQTGQGHEEVCIPPALPEEHGLNRRLEGSRSLCLVNEEASCLPTVPANALLVV